MRIPPALRPSLHPPRGAPRIAPLLAVYALAALLGPISQTQEAARLARVLASAAVAVTLWRASGGRGGRALVLRVVWVLLMLPASNSLVGSFLIGLGLALGMRKTLVPWTTGLGARALAPLVVIPLASLALLVPELGRAAAAREPGFLERADQALFAIAQVWMLAAANRAAGELATVWMRRAPIRQKLVVSFAVFAITPAVLIATFLTLAAMVRSGEFKAAAAEREIASSSAGARWLPRPSAPAPRDAAALKRLLAAAEAVPDSVDLSAAVLARGSGGWRALARRGAFDTVLAAAGPVTDSGTVVRGLAIVDRRFLWIESALWPRGGDSLALITVEPVDSARVVQLGRSLDCSLAFFASGYVSTGGGTVVIGIGANPSDVRKDRERARRHAVTRLGTGAFRGGRMPFPFGGVTLPIAVWEDGRWHSSTAALFARSPLAAVIGPWAPPREPLAFGFGIALLVLAALFLVLEIVSVTWGARIARYITRGAAALRTAAASIGSGDFSTRVRVPSEDEFGDLADSFNRMATGLEEGREAMLERERMRRELELARSIQMRLLPAAAPRVPGLTLAAANAMSLEVGGDYYDFVTLPDGRVGVCVADVSGKGVGAALLMSSVKTALVASAASEAAPRELVARVNRLLVQNVDPGKFVTLVFAAIDPEGLALEYVNAGHPAPVLVRADTAVERLETGGIVLGVLPEGRYDAGVVRLRPGDLVAFFSDGITEALAPDGGLYGDERLIEFLRSRRHLGAAALTDALVAEIRAFEAGAAASDDLTLVILKVDAAA